jgi:hypothetical protein
LHHSSKPSKNSNKSSNKRGKSKLEKKRNPNELISVDDGNVDPSAGAPFLSGRYISLFLNGLFFTLPFLVNLVLSLTTGTGLYTSDKMDSEDLRVSGTAIVVAFVVTGPFVTCLGILLSLYLSKYSHVVLLHTAVRLLGAGTVVAVVAAIVIGTIAGAIGGTWHLAWVGMCYVIGYGSIQLHLAALFNIHRGSIWSSREGLVILASFVIQASIVFGLNTLVDEDTHTLDIDLGTSSATTNKTLVQFVSVVLGVGSDGIMRITPLFIHVVGLLAALLTLTISFYAFALSLTRSVTRCAASPGDAMLGLFTRDTGHPLPPSGRAGSGGGAVPGSALGDVSTAASGAPPPAAAATGVHTTGERETDLLSYYEAFLDWRGVDWVPDLPQSVLLERARKAMAEGRRGARDHFQQLVVAAVRGGNKGKGSPPESVREAEEQAVEWAAKEAKKAAKTNKSSNSSKNKSSSSSSTSSHNNHHHRRRRNEFSVTHPEVRRRAAAIRRETSLLRWYSLLKADGKLPEYCSEEWDAMLEKANEEMGVKDKTDLLHRDGVLWARIRGPAARGALYYALLFLDRILRFLSGVRVEFFIATSGYEIGLMWAQVFLLVSYGVVEPIPERVGAADVHWRDEAFENMARWSRDEHINIRHRFRRRIVVRENLIALATAGVVAALTTTAMGFTHGWTELALRTWVVYGIACVSYLGFLLGNLNLTLSTQLKGYHTVDDLVQGIAFGSIMGLLAMVITRALTTSADQDDGSSRFSINTFAGSGSGNDELWRDAAVLALFFGCWVHYWLTLSRLRASNKLSLATGAASMTSAALQTNAMQTSGQRRLGTQAPPAAGLAALCAVLARHPQAVRTAPDADTGVLAARIIQRAAERFARWRRPGSSSSSAPAATTAGVEAAAATAAGRGWRREFFRG